MLHGSPNQGGVTDTLASYFASGAKDAGANIIKISLGRYSIKPCRGCNCCKEYPYNCVIEDNAAFLYAQIFSADAVVFSAPIYFYGLPGSLKCFVDRGQYLWHRNKQNQTYKTIIPAWAILAAGRKKGKELFSGAELTLKWYCKAINLCLKDTFIFYGLDAPNDLNSQPEINEKLRKAGEKIVNTLKSAS